MSVYPPHIGCQLHAVIVETDNLGCYDVAVYIYLQHRHVRPPFWKLEQLVGFPNNH